MEPGPASPVDRVKITLYADEVGDLLAVQRAFCSRLEPDAVVQIIADEALRLSGADMGLVYITNQDRLEIAAVSGSLGKNLLGYSVGNEGTLAGRTIQSGQPLLIPDLQKSNLPFSPLTEHFSARAILVLPLLTQGGPVGAVLVASRFSGRPGKDDLQILELLLPAASLALLNARQFMRVQTLAAMEERRRIARRLQSLAAQTLFSASLIADVLPRLVELNPQEGRSRMEELREITHKALIEMRSLLLDDH